jgi:Xaa-Pro aminopeptidase
VHPDAYGSVNGYLYDLQRTVVVGGEPTPAQRRILDGAVGVVDALCAAAVAGTPVADLARLSQAWLTEHGFGSEPAPDVGDALTPLVAVGHGLGTGFELPWVDSSSEDRLEPGMTIALEVYVGEEGAGTAVTEEVVLVTADGPEILTAGCPSRRW